MSPGAVCGDPRAAPEYLEARRHARRVPPEGPGNPRIPRLSAGLAPLNPQKPKNWWLWALGL